MRTILLNFLKLIVRWIPDAVLPRLVRRDIFSVFYHAISDQPLDHVRHLYPVVPIPDFESSLAYMRQRFNFVSYAQLHDHILKGSELPPKAIHLSLDDGFRACFSDLRPLLLQQNIPCTFFLTTDWLDNQMLYYRHQASLCVQKAMTLPEMDLQDFLQQIHTQLGVSLKSLDEYVAWITHIRDPESPVFDEVCHLLGIDILAFLAENQPYLTTEQVRQLHEDGFTIGAHSLTHQKLIYASSEVVEKEIVESCQKIQAITGQTVVPFSFPQSAWGVSRELLADIRRRYPFVGLLFDTKDLRKDVPWMVNRIWAERPITPDRVLQPFPKILAHAYRDAWVAGVINKLRSSSESN